MMMIVPLYSVAANDRDEADYHRCMVSVEWYHRRAHGVIGTIHTRAHPICHPKKEELAASTLSGVRDIEWALFHLTHRW
jgi:hypothetical protein